MFLNGTFLESVTSKWRRPCKNQIYYVLCSCRFCHRWIQRIKMHRSWKYCTRRPWNKGSLYLPRHVTHLLFDIWKVPCFCSWQNRPMLCWHIWSLTALYVVILAVFLINFVVNNQICWLVAMVCWSFVMCIMFKNQTRFIIWFLHGGLQIVVAR